MRRVILDIETDGLLDALTQVHSLVLRDLDTNEVLSCADQEGYPSIQTGLAVLEKAERIYGHNIIKFDCPALEKVYGFKVPIEKLRDTLVIAGMRFIHSLADQDFAAFKAGKIPTGKYRAGAQSLEAWGWRLGILKGDYGKTTDWSQWTKELQDYCVQDTAVTKALVEHIQKAGGCPPAAIECEQALAVYLFHQEQNGWPFNIDKAVALAGKLSARREEVGKELRSIFGTWEVDLGEFVPKVNNKARGYVAGVPIRKSKTVEFNPASRQHIATRLGTLYGWKPGKDAFTPSGEPIVDEKVLSALPADWPGVKLLIEYLLLTKRLGQISEGKEAWLRKIRNDSPHGGKLTGRNHIHHRVLQNQTVTHRCAHANPNLGQVPAVGKLFGAECRELFEVPDGWVQVGADLASLEARCLAHYMARYDGGAYGKILLEGDIHTANRIALGLPGDTPAIAACARKGSKNWFYGWAYGGGDPKLGSMLAFILGPDGRPLIPVPLGGWTEEKLAALGAAKRKQFLKNLPAMKRLIDDVQTKAKDPGYITGIDGRRVYIRSKHSALNTLLQSAGAILAKTWVVNAGKRLTAELGSPGWGSLNSWSPLGFIHDELQVAARPDVKLHVESILLEEIRKLTQQFNWRVPLDGEVKSGPHWAACH